MKVMIDEAAIFRDATDRLLALHPALEYDAAEREIMRQATEGGHSDIVEIRTVHGKLDCRITDAVVQAAYRSLVGPLH